MYSYICWLFRVRATFLFTANGSEGDNTWILHLPGEDGTRPNTDDIVGQVELQRVEAEHLHPEKPNFHRRVGALERKRDSLRCCKKKMTMRANTYGGSPPSSERSIALI
ncbi:hypothetical protein EYF80_023248 [Liparis tanakae]|uniref:Secreted protein n=1 Tax=Liparis tanakae TaxID=230148 RepID=A0A4Z2HP57_9TELE|nr:hypothetical protein EYF80_023248 [Liparis tanakae]